MPLTLNLNFGEYRPDLIAHTSPGLVISGAASVTSTGYRSIEAPYGSPIAAEFTPERMAIGRSARLLSSLMRYPARSRAVVPSSARPAMRA
jgi:hypothetical protein